jgi:polar amino acid transport system substrate-binding protein
MKRLLVSAMAGVGLVALACLSGPAAAQTRTALVDKIVKEGTLRVCVAVATPWMFKDPNSNDLVGFDVDMVKALAQAMEVKHELVPVPAFGQLISSLQSGKCDVIMSALTRTTKRAMAVAFTEPYFTLGTVWAVNKDRTDLNTMADLNKPDITLAAEQGALSETVSRKHLPNAQIRSLPGGGDAIRMAEVQTKRADAAAVDNIKMNAYAAAYPWVKFIPADGFDNPVDLAGLAYAVRREDLDFVNFLNVFIFNMNANGTIPALKAKWVKPEYILGK